MIASQTVEDERFDADSRPWATPLPTRSIIPNPFSVNVYETLAEPIDDLLPSLREDGLLVPLVVTPRHDRYLLVSGHRRYRCAMELGWPTIGCEIREFADEAAMQAAVIAYNHSRNKTFRQKMREADALEQLEGEAARRRRNAALRKGATVVRQDFVERGQAGRTDERVARAVGFGSRELYRQARAVWRAAQDNDERAAAALDLLDRGTKTIHAAYKDLRRRDRFSANFKPTPYDVWSFRSDAAFGIPYPGAIPPSIVAHLLYYFTKPGDLVIDPMAGGGSTIDVCTAMGRRGLAYDLTPIRSDVRKHDVKNGFPEEAYASDLIFCDPPYHTMHAGRYPEPGVAELPLTGWIAFLAQLARDAMTVLKPGGHFALLLANQTEKDVGTSQDYLDHAFLGYEAMRSAGFIPVRRISCPMSGAYLPQQVRQARVEGRLLGQVRDLIVMRKPRSTS